MKIVEPSVEYIPQVDPIDKVAKCGHICYCSPEESHEFNVKFYNALISAGHLSVLRHQSKYYFIPYDDNDYHVDKIVVFLDELMHNPYLEMVHEREGLYISTNAQFVLEHSDYFNDIADCEVSEEEFGKTEVGNSLLRYTFCLTTQISTSRELLRHSPQQVTELSTRYVLMSSKGRKVEPSIVRPWFLDDEAIKAWNDQRVMGNLGSDFDIDDIYRTSNSDYLSFCNSAFNDYDVLISHGFKPEDARGVLPLDTMTKIIMTESISQWHRIIDMRYYGTTGRPHPNAKIITGLVKDKLQEFGYGFK